MTNYKTLRIIELEAFEVTFNFSVMNKEFVVFGGTALIQASKNMIVDYLQGSSSSSLLSPSSFSSCSLTCAKITKSFFTSNSRIFFLSLFNAAVLAPFASFLKLGESFKHEIHPL